MKTPEETAYEEAFYDFLLNTYPTKEAEMSAWNRLMAAMKLAGHDYTVAGLAKKRGLQSP